jgi:hypothetical protein
MQNICTSLLICQKIECAPGSSVELFEMKDLNMKNLSLIMLIACGLGLPAVTVSARDYQPNTTLAYSWPWSERLDAEINHLNRMRGHVRWQLGHYRANGSIRREFARISREIDHVNWEFRQRNHDRRHLHREVERLHAALHDIETRLRVRTWDYYRWR